MELMEKIEEGFNQVSKVLETLKTKRFYIGQIITNNYYNFDELYNAFLYYDELKPLMNFVDKETFFKMYQSSLSEANEKITAPQFLIDNLGYFVVPKVLNALVSSVSEQIDKNKFSVSFIDLTKDKNYNFFRCRSTVSSQKINYLQKIHKANEDNGKINFYLVFGASKERSMHSNVLVNYHKGYISMDMDPTKNVLPLFLGLTRFTKEKYRENLRNESEDDFMKESLMLISQLINVLDAVDLKMDDNIFNIVINFLNSKISIGSHLLPLYMIPMLNDLAVKKEALKYLIKEEQYSQCFINRDAKYLRELAILSFNKSCARFDNNTQKIVNLLGAYDKKAILELVNFSRPYQQNGKDFSCSVKMFIQINNRLMDNLLYSMKKDLNNVLKICNEQKFNEYKEIYYGQIISLTKAVLAQNIQMFKMHIENKLNIVKDKKPYNNAKLIIKKYVIDDLFQNLSKIPSPDVILLRMEETKDKLNEEIRQNFKNNREDLYEFEGKIRLFFENVKDDLKQRGIYKTLCERKDDQYFDIMSDIEKRLITQNECFDVMHSVKEKLINQSEEDTGKHVKALRESRSQRGSNKKTR